MQNINPGDTAFILICTALVCMMTSAPWLPEFARLKHGRWSGRRKS